MSAWELGLWWLAAGAGYVLLTWRGRLDGARAIVPDAPPLAVMSALVIAAACWPLCLGCDLAYWYWCFRVRRFVRRLFAEEEQDK